MQTKNRKAMKRFGIVIGLNWALLFGSAGTLQWLHGWLYILMYVVLVVVLSGFFFKDNPDLMEERMTAAKKAVWWDKLIVPLLVLFLPVMTIVTAGLDKRFNLSPDPGFVAEVIAFLVMVFGTFFTYGAMKTNNFFSSYVRIQSDRGHSVVMKGPYSYIRHPGYLGAGMFNISVPIFLQSYWALVWGCSIFILFVVRTYLEDKFLQKELKGYADYASKVRYKLLPYIW